MCRKAVCPTQGPRIHLLYDRIVHSFLFIFIDAVETNLVYAQACSVVYAYIFLQIGVHATYT